MGVTRLVLLVGPFALKVPRFDRGWRAGLVGLLANMQEAEFAAFSPRVCPVRLALPGGWLLVMTRARPLSDREWRARPRPGYWANLPVEAKRDSFGVVGGSLVAVDCGS